MRKGPIFERDIGPENILLKLDQSSKKKPSNACSMSCFLMGWENWNWLKSAILWAQILLYLYELSCFSHTPMKFFSPWYKYFLTGYYLLKIIYYRQNVTPSKIPLKDFFRGYVSMIEHFSHPFCRSDMSTLTLHHNPILFSKIWALFPHFQYGGQIKSQ